MQKRTLQELLSPTGSAWAMIQEWIAIGGAANGVEVLPPGECREEALLETNVTTRSPLGAVVYESGGILVDRGWLRILGSGHNRLASLPEWNRRIGFDLNEIPPVMLVAFDALGGPFVLDGGGLGRAGGIFYSGPESLEWQDTEFSYSEFLRFCLMGDIKSFYGQIRWSGWENELGISGDEGISINPPLNALGPDLVERRRSLVPMADLFRAHGVLSGGHIH